MSKRDYYEVLGVSRTVDRRSRSRARTASWRCKYHPDRNPGDKAAEEKFKECAEAYAILADADKRAAYDRFGHAGVSSAGSGGVRSRRSSPDFGDILGGLGDIFGFGDLFGGGRRRGGPQRGADLRYDLEITFEESAHGAETTDPDSAAGKLRDVQRARAPRPDRRPPSAPSAAARDRCASSRASSPSRARARSAAATGKTITQAVPDLPRRGPRRRASARSR